jgi:hypothetical protein
MYKECPSCKGIILQSTYDYNKYIMKTADLWNTIIAKTVNEKENGF